ncbi:TPA: ead/Ea22-like family protein [Serratia marcescens]|nr:ead/Ea22-like family protein [Serratia marcescens]HBV8348783.1 ead/Ea22-like family protein [Serratia marcescens]
MGKFSELKAAAIAATPGPWFVHEKPCEDGNYGIDTSDNEWTAEAVVWWVFARQSIWKEEDARFIAAANPAVVLALLAELEAKTLEGRCIEQERRLFRVERTAHQQHAQELEKRITELEAIRADASLVLKEIGNELGCNPYNESIMMAIDELKEREKRVVALAGGNADLWETMAARLEAAEAKLARPLVINLPERRDDSHEWDGVSPTEAFNTCRSICGLMFRQQLRAAGFTVEGDAQ